MTPHFSPIQNHILSRLKNAKSLRYSELQPDKVPNDLFNYHLQFLVKKDYVTKLEEGYSLSPKGIQHVADPVPEGTPITSLFKLNVITIVSRMNKGKIEILNQVRNSNPSFGKVGVMGGVVMKGELIEPAAKRKLEQETGLIADLKIVGCERRMLYKDGELFSDIIFPIAYSDEYEGEARDTGFGENKWVSIDEAIKNDSAEYDSIKGIVKVLEAVKEGSVFRIPFFFEETIQSDLEE